MVSQLPTVTVVTVTNMMRSTLPRALRSVDRQDYSRELLTHLVLLDSGENTGAESLTLNLKNGRTHRNLIVKSHSTQVPEDSPWPTATRVAKLRNEALRLVDSQYVCFLDDDNEFETNHVSSLLATLQSERCDLAHSHRQVFYDDGRPCVVKTMPWSSSPDDAVRRYRSLVDAGVFVAGSNVIRDRFGAVGDSRHTRMVDMGEWLFPVDLLREIGFVEEYTVDDREQVIPEDNKLLSRIIQEGYRVGCSNMPTLKYYLGGYSNQVHSALVGSE